jgi:hypothetical protein
MQNSMENSMKVTMRACYYNGNFSAMMYADDSACTTTFIPDTALVLWDTAFGHFGWGREDDYRKKEVETPMSMYQGLLDHEETITMEGPTLEAFLKKIVWH